MRDLLPERARDHVLPPDAHRPHHADAELALRAFKKSRLANNVEWLRDGSEALDYLYCEGQYTGRANGNPKLILLDLKMPRVGGAEVLSRIKSDDTTKMIPVVIMTSSQEERDLVSSYQLGANSYIVKPVDFEQFMDVVCKAGFYWAVLNKVPG